VKNNAGWWAANQISETEFLNAIEFLIGAGIIIVDISENEKHSAQNIVELLDSLSFLEEVITTDKQSNHFINSHGFRGPEISEDKPSNIFRVFVVGGSTTYGAGVNDENTITALLQKKFDEKNHAQTVEIVNAGISGMRSNGEVTLIKEKLLGFSPDIIIVYDGFNDIKSYYGSNLNPERSLNSNKLGSPTEWKNRWIELCKFGEMNDFKTVVTLQPFLGTGDRLYTDREIAMADSYVFPAPLVNGYHDYVAHLEEINQNCAAAYDLKHVFDNHLGAVYFDYTHVGNVGNEIIANIFYEIINDDLKNNIIDEKNIDKFIPTAYSVKKLLRDKFNNEKTEIFDKDYSGQNLSGENFFAGNIRGTDFSNAILVGANFRLATIDDADFTNADLTGASFALSILKNSDLTGAILTDVYAPNSFLIDNTLHNTHLNGANFDGGEIQCSLSLEYAGQPLMEIPNRISTCIDNVNFENTNLTRGKLFNLDLNNSVVKNTKFTMTQITKVNFPEEISADLSGAGLRITQLHGDMSNVIFSCYEFWCTDFTSKIHTASIGHVAGADLSGADFRGVNLKDAIFTPSNPDQEGWMGQTNHLYRENYAVNASEANFSNTDLSGKNLSLVNFNGAIFYGADLSNSDLRYSDLSGANLEGANLQGALIDHALLVNANLKCINHTICD
jgi:uncharacterized protein YjbI with pentapeptide repeats